MAGLLDSLFGNNDPYSDGPGSGTLFGGEIGNALQRAGMAFLDPAGLPQIMAAQQKQRESMQAQRALGEVAKMYGLDPRLAANPDALKLMIGLQERAKNSADLDRVMKGSGGLFGDGGESAAPPAPAAPAYDMLSPSSVYSAPNMPVKTAAAPEQGRPSIPGQSPTLNEPPNNIPNDTADASVTPLNVKKAETPPISNNLFPNLANPASAPSPQAGRAAAINNFKKAAGVLAVAKNSDNKGLAAYAEAAMAAQKPWLTPSDFERNMAAAGYTPNSPEWSRIARAQVNKDTTQFIDINGPGGNEKVAFDVATQTIRRIDPTKGTFLPPGVQPPRQPSVFDGGLTPDQPSAAAAPAASPVAPAPSAPRAAPLSGRQFGAASEVAGSVAPLMKFGRAGQSAVGWSLSKEQQQREQTARGVDLLNGDIADVIATNTEGNRDPAWRAKWSKDNLPEPDTFFTGPERMGAAYRAVVPLIEEQYRQAQKLGLYAEQRGNKKDAQDALSRMQRIQSVAARINNLLHEIDAGLIGQLPADHPGMIELRKRLEKSQPQ